jgi:hypothetical protein
MSKLLKPASIAFFLLMPLTFLVAGLFLGGMIESGKDHGLAGGAVVLGWGILLGGIAFLASLFIAYYLPVKTLSKANWILLILFLAACGYIYLEAQRKLEMQQEKERQFQPVPSKPTALRFQGYPTLENFQPISA